LLAKTIQKMNEFSQSKTPFIALLSFDEPWRDIVCESKFAREFGIRFKFANEQNKAQNAPKYELNFNKISPKIYENALKKVQNFMQEGDVYLLNLCFATPFSCEISLDEIYDYSREKLVLQFRDEFVCFSPENFVQINRQKIETFPMKGTINAQIPNAKDRLLHDEKELAEHCMVVDLLRNDLAKVAQNVQVKSFRDIYKVCTKNSEILQTISKISADLFENYEQNLGDLFARILPAGSISGTPKKRACEIISEVESAKRGFYTGVFVHFDGQKTESFVLIRFVRRVKNGEFEFFTGGGVTCESEIKKEYDELYEKAYFTF
jgi:DNA polymerase III, beta subunit